MVDGILSSVSKVPYELPSQEELIRQAFAGDDVDDDFEKDKQEILNEENPEPEKPLLLPGWGQWTHVQQKKGLPSWMLKKHEDAQKKRAEALKKRKDAQLNNVIISEKIDKKVSAIKYKVLNLWYSFQIIDINLIQCTQLYWHIFKHWCLHFRMAVNHIMICNNSNIINRYSHYY